MGIYSPGRPKKFNPTAGEGRKSPSVPGKYRIGDEIEYDTHYSVCHFVMCVFCVSPASQTSYFSCKFFYSRSYPDCR